jgi:hypothetical protein
MTELLYHPVYAWNLIADLIASHNAKTNGYVQYRLEQGASAGWLNSENQQRAREMLVFADRVLLPGQIDAEVPQSLRDAGHIDWAQWSRTHSAVDFPDPRSRPDEIRQMAPVLTELATIENQITEDELQAVTEYWRQLSDWEQRASRIIKADDPPGFEGGTLQILRSLTDVRQRMLRRLPAADRRRLSKLFEEDPARHADEFSELERRVRETIGTLRETELLATQGVPTLFYQNRLAPGVPRSAIDALAPAAEKAAAVVSLYFQNVRTPRPENLGEALTFRDNPSVQQWRSQVDAWTKEVTAKPSGLRFIRDEIEDANGYIEGAQRIKTALSIFTPWIMVPLHIAAALLPGLEAAHIPLATIEALRWFGDKVEESVLDPDRLRYKWLMLSANHPTS